MIRPWRSIGFKLSLFTSLFVLGVIAVMAQRIFTNIERALISEMSLRAQFFGRSCREVMFPRIEDPLLLRSLLKEVMTERAVSYALVHDAQGVIVSHPDIEKIGTRDESEFAKAALSAAGNRFSRQGAGEHEVFEVAAPIMKDNLRIGTVRLGFTRQSINAALSKSRQQLAVVALAAIALAVAGTLSIVAWIIRPLPRLAAAARELGRGNFNVTVELRAQDEIGSLARAFNDMAVANSLLFRTLREEKEKLETVFNETREGLVWTDPTGRILLINTAAKQLLGFKPDEHHDLEQAFAGFAAKPPIKSLLSARQRFTACEFVREKPKMFILAGACDRLGEENGPASFLLVFHDATLERREEHLSRNFLSLVSHKLRTPITVVLNYVDLLRADGTQWDDFQKKALESIQQESEELSTLVEKLLVFTTAQSRDTIALSRERLSLVRPVEGALKAQAKLLEGKPVSVVWSKDAFSALPAVQADARMIEEVIKNLIENAVKFNTKEQKEVRLAAVHDGDFVRFSVIDNGPGIPAEEHSKLFRRFYQIDEFFTGQIMGMGLGLAFIKNVIDAHGGKVGLNSEVEKGSEFYFTLPVSTETAPARPA